MHEIITEQNIRPYVRCVGCGRGLRQNDQYKAYDHRFIGALNGAGSIMIGMETFPLVPGHAFIISPGTPYCVRSNPDQQVIVINFDWTWEYAARREVIGSVPAAQFHPEQIVGAADYSLLFAAPNGYAPVAFPAAAADLLKRMLFDYLSGGELSALRLSSQLLYFSTCLVHLPVEKAHARCIALSIHAWIAEHAAEPITIADAAAVFHYGESYISRLLRRHCGTGFKQLVIECRLSSAVWLMENTPLSREEIAARTGFYNGQHFSRTYRKKYGYPPALNS